MLRLEEKLEQLAKTEGAGAGTECAGAGTEGAGAGMEGSGDEADQDAAGAAAETGLDTAGARD